MISELSADLAGTGAASSGVSSRAAGVPISMSGASLYISSIVITAAFDVPLNDRLAAVDPASREGTATWADYQRRWTRLNHLRLAVSVASATVLAVSLVV